MAYHVLGLGDHGREKLMVLAPSATSTHTSEYPRVGGSLSGCCWSTLRLTGRSEVAADSSLELGTIRSLTKLRLGLGQVGGAQVDDHSPSA